jgi:putative addiction module component (TIGR02574 family)
MGSGSEKILKEALELPPIERASLVDGLLRSLDKPDEEIDAAWRKEVAARLEEYRAGRIKTIPLDEVLAKYRVS